MRSWAARAPVTARNRAGHPEALRGRSRVPPRSGGPGHFLSFGRPGNRGADGRFQSTADLGRRVLVRDHSPLRSLTLLQAKPLTDAPGTSAVRSTELALPIIQEARQRSQRFWL
jgi:hypothetical protein